MVTLQHTRPYSNCVATKKPSYPKYGEHSQCEPSIIRGTRCTSLLHAHCRWMEVFLQLPAFFFHLLSRLLLICGKCLSRVHMDMQRTGVTCGGIRYIRHTYMIKLTCRWDLFVDTFFSNLSLSLVILRFQSLTDHLVKSFKVGF